MEIEPAGIAFVDETAAGSSGICRQPMCGRRVRAFFLAQYDLDRSTPAARAAFIARVRARIARIS